LTNQHPITPPPELIEQWMQSHSTKYDLARQAAQWGANQELEACCEWLVRNYNYPEAGNPLRATRRPKPPSLKEQALAALEDDDIDVYLIRRALEVLPE
jgi:uncharacterized UBP type Zn finger protein